MEFSNKCIKRAASMSLAVTAGLGLTACLPSSAREPIGQDETQDSSVGEVTDAEAEQYRDFEVRHVYTETGKRITLFGSPNDNGNTRGGLTDNIAYCDGRDLVEMPLQYYSDGGNSVITRSVGHAACFDGRLEPSDFS